MAYSETIKKLDTIGQSEFENLVTWYLRSTKSELSTLIQTGINKEGEPIKCPVDGIKYIEGNPSYWIAVAYTTTELEGLNRKWLGGKKGNTYEEGDIKKAYDEFEQQKSSFPTAKRKLYLATKCLFGNNLDLYSKIMERGKNLEVEIEIVDASQLEQFLDQNPEGQYLRELYLGIDANRLSTSILQKIARQSLILHKNTFGISSYFEIKRDAQSELERKVELTKFPFIAVFGVSGAGKSTLVRQYGEDINSKNGVCIWVTAEEIKGVISLEGFILNAIKKFHPSINSNGGSDAIELAVTIRGGITFFVDDINRLPNPQEAIAELQRFITVTSPPNTSNATNVNSKEPSTLSNNYSSVQFIVPLWPINSTGLKDSKSPIDGWETIELGFYNNIEATRLTEKFEVDDQLFDTLNGDPLLCGLALEQALDSLLIGNSSKAELVATIFKNFVQRVVVTAEKTKRVIATKTHFTQTLDRLIEIILELENPEPYLDDINKRLTDKQSELLIILSETNQVGWIDSRGELEFWRWKHDRLRDALIGRWLAINVLSNILNGKHKPEYDNWLSHPGLAKAWALALTFLPNDKRGAAIRQIASHLPLALIEVIALSLFDNNGSINQIIIECLQQSFDGFNPKKSDFVSEPRWLMLRQLAIINNVIVLDITKDLPETSIILFARLRNGDLLAGLMAIGRLGDRFSPEIKNLQLEQAIEAFAQLYNRCREKIITTVENIPVEMNSVGSLIRLSLTLIGYLAWSELANFAWEIWNILSNDEQRSTLVHIVWALNRCGTVSTQTYLESALLRVREVSDEKDEHNSSKRYWEFIHPMEQTLRWNITAPSAEVWAKVIQEQTDLCDSVGHLLHGIDHPSTLEAHVRKMASKIQVNERNWQYLSYLDIGIKSVPTNPDTRTKLWELIKNDNDVATRDVAFYFWQYSASKSELVLLRGISENDPLFDNSLVIRLQLADREATHLLIKRLHSEPVKWCPYAYLAFGEPSVFKAFSNNLEIVLTGKHYLASKQIFWNLPKEWVKSIVTEKSDLLVKSPLVWSALWRSDVPEALNLISNALVQASSEDLLEFFRDLDMKLKRVTQRMLTALERALSNFLDWQKSRIAVIAADYGFSNWVESHSLKWKPTPLKGPTRKRYWLAESDGISILMAAAAAVPEGEWEVRTTEDFSYLEDRTRVSFDVKELLKRWLGHSPTTNQLIVGAMLISKIGTAEDIPWWKNLKPKLEDLAHKSWANTHFILRLRQWQKVIGETTKGNSETKD